MTMRVPLSTTLCAVVLGAAVLSGCSGGAEDDRTAPADLPHCELLLGKRNVSTALDAMGPGKQVVSALPVKELTGQLVSEAKAWKRADLQHDSYSACRIDVLGEEEGAQVLEATVKWSALLLDSMSEPKHAKTWREVNDQVFVELDAGRPAARLLLACGVPGAAEGQALGLPMEVAVSDSGLDEALRGKLLSEFARALTKSVGCTNAPQVPPTLPE
ncbi:hypothetical protein [Streptomyces fulvorobeus]|uniref:Lipoprotein n=1 Tax=Streptomyces fulvorobeus TaxID=284028 RepID=A0A7J0C6R4_9ACTN|nr:hypothetical protein [Streptomyces fulvorobeus]NYE41088.1 hypothetical protein [Streptomyces fulvorobeus]GFM97416.1 hypothetical protein Sfulv_22270 [Streptomyces fulvorobeus]